ncbi:MAG: C4-type zinc ribbon domain-containing protein, partial [Actinobacteria bacterium]|nr:C4-type zinc ribbon domain-containing protein [Actinomycetota bacterium]
TEMAATFPADLLALYDKLRADNGGVGAGPIERGRCGGCRLDLMNNEKSDIRAAPVDEVLRHDECGRIMVRTAESGL